MIEATNTDKKLINQYSIISLLVILTLSIVIVFSLSSHAASNSEVLIDSVNIGDSSDEINHNLFGFGPIEPASHGGGWGGADDGNLRVVWYNDSANPSDTPTDSPDENYASLQLSIPSNYITTKMEIRALDGIADDSFEIYIENDLVYSYSDEGSTETWKTHEIDISSMDLSGLIEIKIKSTGSKWNSFDTYGQLGISWVHLYAIEGQEVNVRLIDSNNNPLSNGYVEYYKNGWNEFGITDINGNATKLIPKGKYTFKMTYLDASVSKRQDVGVDSTVVFSTISVTVRLENSSGVPLLGGNVSFHSGGWKYFGLTDVSGFVTGELLPRKYTFKMTYLDASVSKRQDVGVDSNVIFKTVNVTVGLFDSIGKPIKDSIVDFHSSGWKFFGFTNVDGEAKKELLPRKYTFRMSYDGASVSKRQDVSIDSYVIFNTINVTVKLQDSNGSALADGSIYYHSGGWKYIDLTDDNGSVYKELLPRKYTFRVTYDDASVSKRQDIGLDSVVVFSTVEVTVKFEDSSGLSISGGNVSFHSGSWKFFGFTNVDGEAKKELLPRKYTFRMSYDGASVSKRQDIDEDSLVVFSTVNVSVRLEDSSGLSVSGGNVSYHSGGWKYFGLTDVSGFVTGELLPRKYTFKMTYLDASVSKRQDVGVDSNVIFSTISVTVRLENSSGVPLSGGNVSFHSGGWKYFGLTDLSGEVSKEILPRKYTFRMSYDGASISKRQDVSSDSLIVFSTVEVTVRLENSSGVPLSGGNISYHSGGWKYFGLTSSDGYTTSELLPRKYTFRIKYDGASISKRQDISENSTVVFSTIEVTVISQDSIGNLLSAGNISYHSSGWKFFGATDSEGQTKNELLPRKYTFKAIYNKTRYIKRQNVGENPVVIIKTDTIDNYPPVADANSLYSGFINKLIQFNGSESYDVDGYIVNYTWDFGDGNTGYGITVEHSYANIGEYIVKLTVKDDKGLNDYNTTFVKVSVKKIDNIVNNNHHTSYHSNVVSNSVSNEDTDESNSEETNDDTTEEKINSPPVADAYFKIASSQENSVIFDASKSCDPDGDDLLYRWDFNSDGKWDTDYSTDPSVKYTYPENKLECKALLEVFDGEETDQKTISYTTQIHVETPSKVIHQESSEKQYYLFIEWWVVFIPIVFSLIVVLYIYKRREMLINKIKSLSFFPDKKQKRICKLISIILQFFYL